MSRRVTVALWLLSCATAQSFAGQSVAQWTTALLERRQAVIGELATGLPDSSQVLAALLADANEDVVEAAATACERAGRAAKPLVPDLLRRLQTPAKSWWVHVQCANALAAIGESSPALTAALLRRIGETEVPRLWSECSRALQRLLPDAATILLAAAARGDLAVSRVEEALRDLGMPAFDALWTAAQARTSSGDLARTVLPRLGWLAAGRLDRAGELQLARQARAYDLRRGFERDLDTDWVLTPDERQDVVTSLPSLQWEIGYGHGHSMGLFRGTECVDGYTIRRLSVQRGTDGDRKRWDVAVATTTLPRALMLDAARQLLMVSRSTLAQAEKPEGARGFSVRRSTANMRVEVHAEVDGVVILHESFCGYPDSLNVLARHRPTVAARVLSEAWSTGVWQDAAVTEADRTWIGERCARRGGDVWWVAERLHALRDGLSK